MKIYNIELTEVELDYLFRKTFQDTEDFDGSFESKKERSIFTSNALDDLAYKLNRDVIDEENES